MPSLLTGRFYFKLTVNGNLVGEYSNDQGTRSLTESAIRTNTTPLHSFVGEYFATWCEAAPKDYGAAILKINSKANCINLFLVEWKSVGDGQDYEGEAMLCDDMIIGDYRKKP